MDGDDRLAWFRSGREAYAQANKLVDALRHLWGFDPGAPR